MDYFQVIIVTILSFKLGKTIKIDPNIAPLVHGKFPWLLKLISYHNDDRVSSCGASIISNEFALTAAHCVRYKTITSQ